MSDFLYSKALLHATYKNGRVGERTEAHERAEFHSFKTDYLFKNPLIPKDLYVARLIQHYVIVKTIEDQLKTLSTDQESGINAFFTLSYLEHLWRTPGIVQDLKALDVAPETISKHAIMPTTQAYAEQLKNLPPKFLLSHFLLHVAGFMHGGAVIRSKYIEPSNKQTTYQITTHQYDFSAVPSYTRMMNDIDSISLSEEACNEVFQQCLSIYETMSYIYDDLCVMLIKPQPDAEPSSEDQEANDFSSFLRTLAISIMGLAIVCRLMAPTVSELFKPQFI